MLFNGDVYFQTDVGKDRGVKGATPSGGKGSHSLSAVTACAEIPPLSRHALCVMLMTSQDFLNRHIQILHKRGP